MTVIRTRHLALAAVFVITALSLPAQSDYHSSGTLVDTWRARWAPAETGFDVEVELDWWIRGPKRGEVSENLAERLFDEAGFVGFDFRTDVDFDHLTYDGAVYDRPRLEANGIRLEEEIELVKITFELDVGHVNGATYWRLTFEEYVPSSGAGGRGPISLTDASRHGGPDLEPDRVLELLNDGLRLQRLDVIDAEFRGIESVVRTIDAEERRERLVSEGNLAVSRDRYEDAIEAYTSAQRIRRSDDVAERLERARELLAEEREREAAEREAAEAEEAAQREAEREERSGRENVVLTPLQEERRNELIADGDAATEREEFTEAIAAYSTALPMKPTSDVESKLEYARLRRDQELQAGSRESSSASTRRSQEEIEREGGRALATAAMGSMELAGLFMGAGGNVGVQIASESLGIALAWPGDVVGFYAVATFYSAIDRGGAVGYNLEVGDPYVIKNWVSLGLDYNVADADRLLGAGAIRPFIGGSLVFESGYRRGADNFGSDEELSSGTALGIELGLNWFVDIYWVAFSINTAIPNFTLTFGLGGP